LNKTKQLLVEGKGEVENIPKMIKMKIQGYIEKNSII